MENKTCEYNSPFGNMLITASEKGITNISFNQEKTNNSKDEETSVHKAAAKQLAEYFAGKRKTFDLPLDLKGTEFQTKVWKALYETEYGTIMTYKDIAEQVGSPKGYRAVGLANNKNPIPIICACHRIVGSNGSLVGYAYGLDMKEKLIKLEKGEIKL